MDRPGEQEDDCRHEQHGEENNRGDGLLADRLKRRGVLLGASCLMLATGLGFFGWSEFWPRARYPRRP